jgi:hypothetical protein
LQYLERELFVSGSKDASTWFRLKLLGCPVESLS